MKLTRLFLLIFLVMAGMAANAQTYFLLPENFYPQKNEKLTLHLITSDDFTRQTDVQFQPAKTAAFALVAGKKKIDLAETVKDTASVITCTPTEEGLNLLFMTTTTTSNEMSRAKFLRTLDESDPDKIADKVKTGNQLYYKERYTSYVKTLVQVSSQSSNGFDKPLNQDLEIILKQNPYKFNYGDDIQALVLFKGKPLVNAVVNLYVKTVGGNVFPQKLSSDLSGLIYFKLSREGIYFLATRHADVSKDKAADFETWRASYTFAFSSSNELPNTYREFGLGNVH